VSAIGLCRDAGNYGNDAILERSIRINSAKIKVYVESDEINAEQALEWHFTELEQMSIERPILYASDHRRSWP